MHTDRTLYSKYLKIDHRTLTKIKFVLNEESVQVLKNQVEDHDEKTHDEEEEQHISGDYKFVDILVTPLRASSSEDVGTSFWRSMIEGWLKHKEDEVHHIREDVRNIKDMMTSLLSLSLSTTIDDCTTII